MRPIAIIALLLLACGCGGVIRPPDFVEEPTRVFVKLESRHASIVLPRAPGRYVEFTFGHWRYFALADTRLVVGLQALLVSGQSAFGKVEYAAHPMEAARDGPVQWLGLTVDRRRVEALTRMLDARWTKNVDTYHYNPMYDIAFVQDDERYHLFNNCNHLVARWLTHLGCRVDGATVTNRFRLAGDRPSK